MSSAQISRRAFAAGIMSVPTLGVSAALVLPLTQAEAAPAASIPAPAATIVKPAADPIFEAIKVYRSSVRQCNRHYDKLCQAEFNAREGIAWDKRTGLTVLRKASKRALRDQRSAGMRMARTRPTTPAGLAVLIDYVRRDSVPGKCDWHSVALKTAAIAAAQSNYTALQALAVRS